MKYVLNYKLFESRQINPADVESLEKLITPANKKIIYDGIIKIGTKLFRDSHTKFVHNSLENTNFDVYDTTDSEDGEIVDDGYYLGVIFDYVKKEVEELPGYNEKEGEQITHSFINKWYKSNPGCVIISYDASLDSIAILSASIKTSKSKSRVKFKAGDRVVYTSVVNSTMKGMLKKQEGKEYIGTVEKNSDGLILNYDGNKGLPSYANSDMLNSLPNDSLRIASAEDEVKLKNQKLVINK